MRDIDLFQLALGLTPPWTVVSCEFDLEKKRLDLGIDYPRGSLFTCPECGKSDCKAHDSTQKTWRHLNFFQYEAYLSARVPRTKCDKCGIKLVKVPWAREGSGFTLLFEAMVLMMVKSMPVRTISRNIGEHDTRLWRILDHYVHKARENTDLSAIHRVGADETASRRGHKYVSVFVDMDKRRVMFATEGKDAGTVAAFKDDLKAHKGDSASIAEVCADISPAFISGFPIATAIATGRVATGSDQANIPILRRLYPKTADYRSLYRVFQHQKHQHSAIAFFEVRSPPQPSFEFAGQWQSDPFVHMPNLAGNEMAVRSGH